MTVRRALVRSTVAFAVVAAALTTAIAVAPLASADPPGTVQATVDEPTGSFLTGFCVAPAHPVLGSPQCSDRTSLLGLQSVTAGGWTPIPLPPGSYTTALAAVGTTALSPIGSVTVTSSQTIGCTYTMAAAPVCGGTGTVVVTAGGESGASFLTGFCIDPSTPVAAMVSCSDTTSLLGLRSVAVGVPESIPLPARHYQAALANDSGPG